MPKYRSKLRIGGEIVFEHVVRDVEVLREVLGENKNESTHVVEESLYQVPEAGQIVFGGPLVWAYQMVLG